MTEERRGRVPTTTIVGPFIVGGVELVGLSYASGCRHDTCAEDVAWNTTLMMLAVAAVVLWVAARQPKVGHRSPVRILLVTLAGAMSWVLLALPFLGLVELGLSEVIAVVVAALATTGVGYLTIVVVRRGGLVFAGYAIVAILAYWADYNFNL